MRRVALLAAGLLAAGLAGAGTGLDYSKTKTVDVVDDYFGTTVKDPYRWLEDDNSAETKAWVEAENEVTFAYLASIPERKPIEKRLAELWNYERYGLPSKEGPWYVWSRNDGPQNQAVVYRAKSLDAAGELRRRRARRRS
jgi:prolyl oligopeptidase